jgi:hypothetical protein
MQLGFLFDLFEKEWVKVPGRTVMAFNEVAKALENQVRFILLEGAPSVLQPETVIETYNPVVVSRAGIGSSVAASEDLESRKNM